MVSDLVKRILLEKHEPPIDDEERGFREWVARRYPNGTKYVPGQEQSLRLAYGADRLNQFK